jgi:choline-sulfatase
MNVLFFLSDQHNPFYTGCDGHPLAETPNIDRIANQGARFEYTYSSCPICVPARASLFTGKYVFENKCWDNATPWDGTMNGWSHFFRDNNIELTTIGKLDFMKDVDHGIGHEINGGHRGSYDIHALYREQEIGIRWGKKAQMGQSGPRDDLNMEFHPDFAKTTRAIEWLKNERPADQPWVLNHNCSQPHPGWPCPPELWEKWNPRVKTEDLPEKFFEEFEHLHPYHQDFSRHQTGAYATDEEIRRCVAAYLAHCEMVDINVGRILDALEEEGILNETLFIYASDHGETCGAHMCFGKMSQYEDSIRVPMVMMGPGIKAGHVEQSPVSHLDIFPTICEAVELENPGQFRGISLLDQAKGKDDAERHEYVLSEYHANGFRGSVFSVSDGRMKYVECVGERPILFDLRNDPNELHDWIVEKPDASETKETVTRFRSWLQSVCDPEQVDTLAKKEQAELKDRLEQSGQLVEEIYKRGYKRQTDRLVPREEVIPEGFTWDGKKPS